MLNQHLAAMAADVAAGRAQVQQRIEFAEHLAQVYFEAAQAAQRAQQAASANVRRCEQGGGLGGRWRLVEGVLLALA